MDGELVLSTLYDGLGEQVFSLRYTEVEAGGTIVTRRPQSADGNEAESGSPSPALNGQENAETPESASNLKGEADPFLYVFGVCFLSLSGGINRASSVFHARQFGEWWLETFWDKDDASHAVDYGAELEGALEDAGFSGRDVSNMQGAGVSEEDARAIAETRTTDATTEDGTVPEIDAVYRVNDLLSEYTEVLMTASEVYGESYYTYGDGRLYSDDGKGEKQTYLYDGRGSVTAVMSRLEVVCSLSYTDYGAAVGEPPHEFQSFFGYNGEEHDPLTGLQYLRARYYDPAVGSFTTRDPFEGTAETPLSQNGFTYAHNNPVNLTDPSGMFVKPFKVMNDGGSSSRKPKVGAAAAAAATVAMAKSDTFRDEAAYRSALNTLSRPQSTVPRPGRPILPEELERLKAQTLVYLHEGCNPNAKRARSQDGAAISAALGSAAAVSSTYSPIGNNNMTCYPEAARISNQEYVAVQIKGGTSYGGNQSWIDDGFYKKYACGLIAISDLWLYLGESNPNYHTDWVEQAYDESGVITQELYREYVKATDLMPVDYSDDNLDPSLNGIPRPVLRWIGLNGYAMEQKFNSYSEEYDLGLTAQWKAPGDGDIVGYITEMLNNDIPVITSVGPFNQEVEIEKVENGKDSSFGGHYITITEYIPATDGQEAYFVISSWGSKYTMKVDDYLAAFNEGTLFNRTFTNILYIKETE